MGSSEQSDNNTSPTAQVDPRWFDDGLVRHQKFIAKTVRRLAGRKLLRKHLLEDLVQEVMEKAVQCRATFENRGERAF